MKRACIANDLRRHYDTFTDKSTFILRCRVTPGDVVHEYLSSFHNVVVFDKEIDLPIVVSKYFDPSEQATNASLTEQVVAILKIHEEIPSKICLIDITKSALTSKTESPLIAFYLEKIFALASERAHKLIISIEEPLTIMSV